MSTIKVEIAVRVIDEDIDGIMSSALEGGICYWCGRAEVVGEYLGDEASEQISKGGKLKLYDLETDEVYELDKEKLLKGIKMYIEDPERPYQIVCDEDDNCNILDVYMIDGCVADMIVQYALFDEIIFA